MRRVSEDSPPLFQNDLEKAETRYGRNKAIHEAIKKKRLDTRNSLSEFPARRI
jgi:hypothetical protein